MRSPKLEQSGAIEYLEAYPSRVSAITLKSSVKAKDLRPDALTWVIVGDLDVIEDKVREMNLGEVTILKKQNNDCVNLKKGCECSPFYISTK